MPDDSVTSREMRAIELNCEYLGVSALQLMENAGRAVAQEVMSRFPSDSRIVVYCGTGRNGGDGMVVTRHLAGQGFHILFQLLGRETDIREPIVIQNWMTLKHMSSSVEPKVVSDSSQVQPCEADVIIDALLGTGARGSLRAPILQAIKAVNESKGFRLAVDVPSGLDSDTGRSLGDVVKADLTVTFHKVKTGFADAKEYLGEIKVAEIGIPPEAELYTGPGDAEIARKPRLPSSHKGDFGRLLVVGGSETYAGAPAYVALAALRTGVDLAVIAAPEKTAYAISSFSPDLITLKLTGDHLNSSNVAQLRNVLEKSTAIVIGPGLGSHKETISALEKLFDLVRHMKKPALIDADAIGVYGACKIRFDSPLVLTPHPGEFEELTGKKPRMELKEKIKDVKKAALDKQATILLKGAVDIVSDGKHVKLNSTGNPGMTVGGTGDVLAGIVGALISQGYEPFEASAAGAFINGAAGDVVCHEKGFHIVASDLIQQIPTIFENPIIHKEYRIDQL
jgi:NAD(P)H-hydrate epimerase